MTRHEAGNALWEAAVLCGRLEAQKHYAARVARLLLHMASSNASRAGVADSDVEHVTRLGLEWGRQEAEEGE